MNSRKRFVMGAIVVLWVWCVVIINWLVEPGFVEKAGWLAPSLQAVHDVLRPFVHRPYIF